MFLDGPETFPAEIPDQLAYQSFVAFEENAFRHFEIHKVVPAEESLSTCVKEGRAACANRPEASTSFYSTTEPTSTVIRVQDQEGVRKREKAGIMDTAALETSSFSGTAMSHSPVNRRQFAYGVAAGLTGAAFVPGDATADEKDEKPEPSPPKLTEADARLLQVMTHYDDERLTEDVFAAIQRDIRYHISRGRQLSRFPLANGDEPAFVFAAYRQAD